MYPMGLNALWKDYKTNNYSVTRKFNKQPYDVTQKTQGVKPIVLYSPMG